MKFSKVGYRAVSSRNLCIDRPQGTGDYTFMLIRTGAVFVINGARIVTKPGSFVLFRKGSAQYYTALEDQYIDDFFRFDLNSDELDELTRKQIPFDTPTALGDITQLSEIIMQMYQEMYSANPLREQTLELYFKLFMIKLAEKLNYSASIINSPHYQSLSALRTGIYRHPSHYNSVSQMAAELNLSESHFQHLYKQIFHVGVITDVINSRIKYAQLLLSATDDSIAEIAEKCGYKTDIHFTKQFKKNVGITPTGYRKQFRFSPGGNSLRTNPV